MTNNYRLICRTTATNKFNLEIRYSKGDSEHLADFTNIADLEKYIKKHFNGAKVLCLLMKGRLYESKFK